MEEEEETARVSMYWPKDLKDAVREKGGPRNITEFTIEAVRIHLEKDPDIAELHEQLNQAKYTVQLLADRLVMGGEHSDRMQALLEVELPDYLDTTGWPPAFAERVRPVPSMKPVTIHEDAEAFVAHLDKIARDDDPIDPAEIEPEVKVVETIPAQASAMMEKAESPRTKELLDAVSSGGEDDFFSKIMSKTGQDLSGVPGLKPASALKQPEAKPVPTPVENLCPKCGEELIDGECWTCA